MQHSRSTLRYRAFSLVELSIVLVILGLLVGGVLAGKSLIRASELRAIPVEKDKFTAAIFSFRDKYFQLPGDINNAFQFWGATCGTNTTDPSTGCNGNGEGFVQDNTRGEDVKIWEHLARSGLIEGSYDGAGAILGMTLEVELLATNTPQSKLSGSGWKFSDNYQSPAGTLPSGTGHYYTFGQFVSGSRGLGKMPSVSLAEAWNIDVKTDDGRGDTGKMRGDTDEGCADNGVDPYNLSTLGSDTRGLCIFTFIFQ